MYPIDKKEEIKEYERGFYWSSKAWYSETRNYHHVMFGLYHLEGGTIGEMKMEWIKLGHKWTPRLQVFCDGWFALSTFNDLIQRLEEVDDQDITEKQFVDILLDCGFEDLTKYEFPYE